MNKMEKGIKYTLIAFGILVLADVVSTLFSWKLLEHLESNPLFKFGTVWGLILAFILNLLVMYIFYKIYTKTENIDTRFYLLLIMVSVITTRCYVVYQNIQVALNPPTLELIQSIGVEQMQKLKTQYLWQIITLNVLPYINGAITWILFKKDHCINKLKSKVK